jgi:hypothetical protein
MAMHLAFTSDDEVLPHQLKQAIYYATELNITRLVAFFAEMGLHNLGHADHRRKSRFFRTSEVRHEARA